MIQAVENPRLHWDHERGWIVDVQTALSKAQIERIARWALPIQKQRLRGLPPGDKKDECVRSVRALERSEIQQRVANADGTVFASTERTKPGRSFFLGTGE